jgi:hypothetical protein
MDELKRTLEDSDIDGPGIGPDGAERTVFRPNHALALMLLNGDVFIVDGTLCVNCSDVFVWGSSDEEELPLDEIEPLYRLWRERPWGSAIWCMIKRRQMPQEPVEEAMRKAGWDLDALKDRHGLRNNEYDGVGLVLARRKYAAYSDWERDRGRQPRPFEARWWEAWDEYRAAHPDWPDEGWQAEDRRLCDRWRQQNGYPAREVPAAAERLGP